MENSITLTHERVDDILLLFGLVQHLNLPTLVEEHLGTHGLQQGVSNGLLLAVWLVYILSEGDHAKSTVAAWVARHQRTLEALLAVTLRPTDFTDDRLGNLLRRLSDTPAWERLEAAVWQSTATVYVLPAPERIRLDSTTVSGFHTRTSNGLMQLGHSNDHRPDLAQLKLMAAAAEPSGPLLASDVHPGQRADDGLYTPLITRVRAMLGHTPACSIVAIVKWAPWPHGRRWWPAAITT